MKKGRNDCKPVVEVTDTLPPWKPGTQKPLCEKKEPKVELVYDPSIAEEYRRELAEREEKIISYVDMMQKMADREQLEVCAVRSRALEGVCYRKTADGTKMILERTSMLEGFIMTAKDWIRFSDEIRQALEQLNIRAGAEE